MTKRLAYDFYNQVPHDEERIGTITTTIGEASMRTSWKLIELYED